ncbi:calcium-related spray [Fusarium coicis]|nr:calcium-related spray [Fusarium coicis]
MTRFHSKWSAWKVAVTAATLVTGVLGDNILKTSGVADCGSEPGISIDKLDISYDNDKQTVTFDVAGTSDKQRNVSAILEVNAYGRKVYENSINPCSKDTPIPQLCPLPDKHFAAAGSQKIDSEWANKVPSIAFQVPDISAQATLRLVSVDNPDEQVACFQAQVGNGKTASVPAVTYLSVGVVGAALLVSGASAASSALSGSAAAGHGGAPSPSFAETLGWFQGMAMNGMLSVDYPPVYRSFAKNFGFSAGIIPWESLQKSIDNFRNMTGGDLANDSFDVLKNATLVFSDNSTSPPEDHSYKVKRAFSTFESLANLAIRGVETSVGDASESEGGQSLKNQTLSVAGISAYVQQYSVPKSNTFMMVLLIVAIIIATIIVSILLVKAILEFWALFGSFPQSLAGFREHYWGSIARTITHLILVLYGIWVLYCVFQFTVGDSWAAQLLAGVTLAIFTGILGWFTWKIFSTVKKLKSTEGNADALYNDKEYWVKYSLFYESYKKDYWWIFIPTIVYLFAKGCTLAVGDGNGLAQTIAQLVVESIFLCLLVWTRPFERKSSNIIGIAIQTVRVLSVALILVFVHELKIPQDSKTIAGIVLIAVQSALTGLLVILIIWNAINVLVKENPHRKRRKEMEKAKRDMDTLTPLDARNSLLLDRKDNNNISMFAMPAPQEKGSGRSMSPDQYRGAESGYQQPPPNYLSSSPPMQRNLTNMDHNNDSQYLMDNAAPVAWTNRDPSPVGMGRYDSGDTGYSPLNKQQTYGYGNGGGYRGF